MARKASTARSVSATWLRGLVERLEHSWRPLNGGLTIMTLLLGGARFIDGVYVAAPAQGLVA